MKKIIKVLIKDPYSRGYTKTNAIINTDYLIYAVQEGYNEHAGTTITKVVLSGNQELLMIGHPSDLEDKTDE